MLRRPRGRGRVDHVLTAVKGRLMMERGHNMKLYTLRTHMHTPNQTRKGGQRQAGSSKKHGHMDWDILALDGAIGGTGSISGLRFQNFKREILGRVGSWAPRGNSEHLGSHTMSVCTFRRSISVTRDERGEGCTSSWKERAFGGLQCNYDDDDVNKAQPIYIDKRQCSARLATDRLCSSGSA